MPVFVILHYLSAEMTQQCVDTLQSVFASQKYHVVIVDNGSPNGSGALLQERYGNTENCTVLLSPDNLGFAKGNNLGYRYAVESLAPEFLIVLNNDVLVEDPQFFEKLRRIYDETGFYVLGPDIFAPKAGMHQNPMARDGYTLQQVKNIIRQRQQWLRIYPLHFWGNRAKAAVKKLLGHRPQRRENLLAKERRITDPVLHGACYIFSPKFLAARVNAFDPGTFLYFEEDILHYICKKNGYLMLYDSSICVKHMEDVSTNMAFRSQYRKTKMKYQNLVASASVLRDYMEKEGQ